MPKRINPVIEWLEQDQPVYYTGPSERSYEGGKRDAQTWADYITYDFEHGPFDMVGLRDYLRGLVDGGPIASGHQAQGEERLAEEEAAVGPGQRSCAVEERQRDADAG